MSVQAKVSWRSSTAPEEMIVPLLLVVPYPLTALPLAAGHKFFNEQYSHAFDAVLNITTIAVEPPPVGGLDLISAKVLHTPHMHVLVNSCGCCLFKQTVL